MIAMVVLGLAYPQSALACGGASAASSHFSSLGLFLGCEDDEAPAFLSRCCSHNKRAGALSRTSQRKTHLSTLS